MHVKVVPQEKDESSKFSHNFCAGVLRFMVQETTSVTIVLVNRLYERFRGFCQDRGVPYVRTYYSKK